MITNNYLLNLLEQKPNGKTLVVRLQQVREKAKELLLTINIMHPQFTLHTIEHKDKIIEIYSKVFPRSLLEALNQYELFFLISATYLHDIGMGELAKLKDIEFNNISDSQKASIIRDRHHIRTEEYLNKFPSDFYLDNSEAYIIGRICRGHRNENLFDTQKFKFDYTFDLEKINIPLLASMLKLADELDMAYPRTPKIIYENITLSSNISADEWNKHLSIDGVALTLNNSIIKCNGRTSKPKIFLLIKQLADKINGLVIQLPYHLHEYSQYTKDLPRSFQADIECQGFLPWDIKFLFEETSIMRIFSGLYIYQRRQDAIRELIKNSLDACKFRRDGDSNFKDMKISIQLNKDEKTLIIDDNGVGMDEFDLKNYLAKIGSSIYESSEFKKGTHNFNPLSELGIGFLSSFMLASRIEVETKKSGSKPIKIEIENISDYLIVRESEKLATGTTIKLYLKEDISENLRLSEEIDFYIKHVDVPIKVKENGTEHVVYSNAFQTPTDLITYLEKYNLRLYDIPIKSKNFEGLLSLCMRYDESNGCFVPMKRFGNQDLSISWKDLRIISSNGIYVPDTSILPPWLVISPYYIDINFTFEGLVLGASRSRFIRNKAFHDIKNELEEIIIDAFKSYLDSIRSKFSNDLKKTAKIANLFNSHFGSVSLLYVHPEDITKNILRYTRENYYFRCISEGKYTYMTANQILEKELILTSEAPWERGNDRYLEELSQSEDFDKNINYVILTDDEVHFYHVREGVKKNTIIHTIFKKEKVIPLADLIKFESVNILDKSCPNGGS